MGKGGPPPTPKEILKAKGSWRAKVGDDKEAIIAIRKKPLSESILDDIAREKYEEMVPLLMQMRILSTGDKNSLNRYCMLWARFKLSYVFCQKHGEVYTTEDKLGNVKHNMYPQAKLYLELSDKLLRLEKEFGLTPSARTCVSAVPENPKDQDDNSILDVG